VTPHPRSLSPAAGARPTGVDDNPDGPISAHRVPYHVTLLKGCFHSAARVSATLPADLRLQAVQHMWPPAHAFGELALILGMGAPSAGIVRIVWVEGRIALIVGVTCFCAPPSSVTSHDRSTHRSRIGRRVCLDRPCRRSDVLVIAIAKPLPWGVPACA
jgi:hypothetical protein